MASQQSSTLAPEQRVLDKRYSCVGLTYYSAWHRTHGHPPACIGFSQVKEADLSDAKADSPGQPLKDAAATEDFKLFCLGYSSCSNNQPAMPHCEGIEIVLEVPSQANATAGERQSGLTSGSSAATEDQAPHTRLMSKAVHNWGLIQAAWRNEGPIVFKPLPKDQDELQARVTETLQRNGKRMYTGVVRVGQSAYASTVEPMVAILGLKPRSKS